MLGTISSYFNWLQKDVPTGEVIRYPIVKDSFQSQVEGLYLVGDITGLPLLKFAAKQGHDVIVNIADELAKSSVSTRAGVYDVAIVGAGAAGLAAGLEAKKRGLHYIILESARTANTILNFPKEKLIFAEPKQIANPSKLPVREATKEETLETWQKLLKEEQLEIHEGMKVTNIQKKGDYFDLSIESESAITAHKVILAIGKSGSSKMLNIPGETLPKVTSKLFSPLDYHNQDLLVVGGGDSAVETALALVDAKNRVTISYRKNSFFRLKEANADRIKEYEEKGKIKLLFNSELKEIREKTVLLKQKSKDIILENDTVFKMIGSELPYDLLERIGITIENTWTFTRFLLYSLGVFIFTLVYFGKHLNGTKLLQLESERRFAEWTAPAVIVTGLIAVVFTIYFRANRDRYSTIKSFIAPVFVGLTTIAISLFSLWYVSDKKTFLLLGQNPGFWYSTLYSVTMLIFGVRRIIRKRSSYITKQTLSLLFFQLVMLFLFPIYLPWLFQNGYLPKWLEEMAFPNQSYWRIFGLILAYPLFIYNVLTDQPSTFWLILSFLQTFVIIPLLIYFYGKGVYCGWVCSCGGLAETLGDDYRSLAPHGEKAKRFENIGQLVLAAVVLISVIWSLGHWTSYSSLKVWGYTLKQVSESLRHWYELIIDIGFAGAIGLGTYFFYSGRIWCRYGCPLAALMHIYTRFSRYRIFADKKKCISCNLCTKSCHMGIDVMGYASQGRPMDDVECVRCSACIVSCPMDVLSFGQIGKGHPHDPTNRPTKLYSLKS
ncbi:MAG: NAD(P)-binding domain-containing protein, partial [Blastocatellia bacterium]|nr:NAD(P)-binding domain-containing protein [Blastocatellia bacterium]